MAAMFVLFQIRDRRTGGQTKEMWILSIINSILTSHFILVSRWTVWRHDVISSSGGTSSCIVDKMLPWRRNVHNELSGFKSNCNKYSEPSKRIKSILCFYFLIPPYILTYFKENVATLAVLTLARKYFWKKDGVLLNFSRDNAKHV